MSVVYHMPAEVYGFTRTSEAIWRSFGVVWGIHLPGTPHRFCSFPPYLIMVVIGGQSMGYLVKKDIVEMIGSRLWILYKVKRHGNSLGLIIT